MVVPEPCKHIWKYISFHYEFAFGYEFFKAESILHFDNLGVNALAPRIVGNTSDMSVLRLKPPKLHFTSTMTRFGFAYKASLPISICKAFSKARASAYKSREVVNTLDYQYSNPVYKLNRTRKAKIPIAARVTPTWKALRELLIFNKDIGKISFNLPDHLLYKAINQYPFAEDPLEAKATGGLTVQSLYVGTFGMTSENAELVDVLLASDRLNDSFYVYRKDLPRYPPSAFWDGVLPVSDNPTTKIISNNPYLVGRVFEDPAVKTATDTQDLSLRDNLISQLTNLEEITADVFASVDNWDSFFPKETEYPFDPGGEDDTLEDFYDLLEDDPTYRPHSPSEDVDIVWKY
jgi:hypothetical protein